MESYEEAKAQAQKICARIEDGSMPCDEPCPEERLALFKRWMEEGMAP
jgi:exonuclease VII small subunit